MSRQSVKLLENLPGNRLPTNLQLMQRYECIRKSNCNTNTTDICEILVEEVLAIWNKAYIPAMEKRTIKKKLELVVLSLFSDKLDDAQKNKCRRAMLNHYTEDLSVS